MLYTNSEFAIPPPTGAFEVVCVKVTLGISSPLSLVGAALTSKIAEASGTAPFWFIPMF